MQGLQALMQRGLMPGQAGAFSALPQQQGRNPIAYTKSLKQLSPEELLSLYNDPNDLRPKWAVASAYADAVKAKAMSGNVQGQQAMAQNAQQQQQLPVADEVMSVMAANGGLMRSFSNGDSTNVFEVLQQLARNVESAEKASIAADEVLQRYGLAQRQSDPEGFKNARENAKKAQEALDNARRSFRAGPTMTAGVPQATDVAKPIPGPAQGRPVERNVSSDIKSDIEQGTDEKLLAPTNLGVVTAQPATTGLSAVQDMVNYRKLMEDQYKTLTEEMRKSEKEPEDIKTGRQRVADLRSAQIQQAQEDARRIRETGVARLQKMLDSARVPIMNDPRALFAIAASINPEKGKTFSSFARGIQDVLTEREARAEKAEQGIEALSDKIRLLNSQYREAQALEEERQQALRVKNYEKARDLEIRIQQIGFDMRKTQATLQIGEMEASAKREAAGASREASDATRQANLQNRVTIALQNRQNAYQKAKDNWSKSLSVKQAEMMANAPNAKEADVKKWEDMQKAFETAFRNSEEIRNLDAAIARMSQEAGIPAPISRSDWGQLSVTPAPAR